MQRLRLVALQCSLISSISRVNSFLHNIREKSSSKIAFPFADLTMTWAERRRVLQTIPGGNKTNGRNDRVGWLFEFVPHTQVISPTLDSAGKTRP